MGDLSPNIVAALAAFPLGAVLGAVVQATNFCTMGAIADTVLVRDWRRLRSWLLAIAVAMAGTQTMAAMGTVDLGGAIYLSERIDWAGTILGGLVFGIGMVFAGGCSSRNLVRLGTGDLRALVVVLVIGISATMTLYGLIALPRVGLEGATAIDLAPYGIADQGVPRLIAGVLGQASADWGWLLGLALAAAIGLFCFASAAFRASRRDIAAGLTLGALVAAGWWVTGVLAADPFEPQPLTSLTFVAPVGNGLVYLMTFTGSKISFGVAAVGGVIAGAFIMALWRGELRLRGFADTADMLRSLAGGALMGVGGVTALGCTIGQGITGLSTLAIGSFIAFAALIAGGVAGVHLLDRLSD